ncbi:MAG: thioredoxin [Acholeplasmataceae bacterium]
MLMNEYQGQPYQELIGRQGLVVVQYYATWCGPCKMLKPVLEALSDEMTDVNFSRVDIDLYRNQAIEAGIKSVPTVVIYKAGKEVDRSTGYQPKERVAAWITQHQ